jgi:hypothetical protein
MVQTWEIEPLQLAHQGNQSMQRFDAAVPNGNECPLDKKVALDKGKCRRYELQLGVTG